ncbi:MAG: HNH endonuclease [Aggregatilineales bacterium]
MPDLSWSATKRLVYERAGGCCEYCQTCEANTAQSMHIEHIVPAFGDSPDNLCLSCPNCNFSKAKAVAAVDPETNQVVALFHPRTQTWSEHFAWVNDGLLLQGLTMVGRATIARLKMNQQRVLTARRRWIAAGHHPPKG